MDKYLDEADAKRYRELLDKGVVMSYVETEEYKELSALMDKSVARQIEIFGEPKHTPFEGKCRRCGAGFTNPVPEVTVPGGDPEIACVEFCAECNVFVMNITRRWATAYAVDPKELVDPVRGGRNAGKRSSTGV